MERMLQMISEENYTPKSTMLPKAKTGNSYCCIILLIAIFFVTDTLILITVQYNSSISMSHLILGNQQQLKALKIGNYLREVERDMVWIECRTRAAVATDDTSHLTGIDKKTAHIKILLDSLSFYDQHHSAQIYITKLIVLADQRRKIKDHLLRLFNETGSMDDKSVISNTEDGPVSSDVGKLTHIISDRRQEIMSRLNIEIAYDGKKGQYYNNAMTILILITGAGLCWFIIVRIKGQNQLILKLNMSEKKSREAAQVKECFMANMSHEIRTPLNSILGFTAILKRCQLPEDQQPLVNAIQHAGENLLCIVNDILDLSKIETGALRIVNEPFSLSKTLQSVEILFGEKANAKGLRLLYYVDDDIPDVLTGDAIRLTQICVNLIGNALKFTERGEILVEVHNNGLNGNSINIGFAISDSGIGISEEKLSEIFERFRQAEDSTSRFYGGTGLGLSIVKDLVTLQGGCISVESVIGKGTTFKFNICYKIAETPIDIICQKKEILFEPVNHMSVRILVVDDNEMNQSLMKHLLSQWKFLFEIASSALEAIQYLMHHTFDLVLMDIQMPGMDGYSAANYIRNELDLKLPIIAMTAHAMAGERERCLSYGMNEYLAKPINEDHLFELIVSFVNVRRSLDTEWVNPLFDFRHIDSKYIKVISKGNISYERMVTQQFIKQVPKDLEILQQAYAYADYQTLAMIAHELKTSITIMGIKSMLGPSLDLLQNAKVGDIGIDKEVFKVKQICTAAVIEAQIFYERL